MSKQRSRFGSEFKYRVALKAAKEQHIARLRYPVGRRQGITRVLWHQQHTRVQRAG